MSNPSNASTSTSAAAASSSTPRVPNNIILYSYAERFVYVATPDTYDDAIKIAKNSFRELRDVERERISIEFDTIHPKTQQCTLAKIGPTAWSMVMASLPPLYVIEIHVAPVSPHGQTASAVGLPPYGLEKREHSDSQTNVAPCGPQTPNSQSPSSRSNLTRAVDRLSPKSSPSRPSS